MVHRFPGIRPGEWNRGLGEGDGLAGSGAGRCSPAISQGVSKGPEGWLRMGRAGRGDSILGEVETPGGGTVGDRREG